MLLMHDESYAMLATPWFPGLNPVGLASIVPFGIVCVCFILVRIARWRHLESVAPILFAVCAYQTDGFPGRYRGFPDADDFVGYYCFVLAGALAALDVARRGTLNAFVYGSASLLCCTALLALEINLRLGQRTTYSFQLSDNIVQLISWSIWIVVNCALMALALRPYRRERRRIRGECVECGYNLRRSSDRCPECGTHITEVSTEESLSTRS